MVYLLVDASAKTLGLNISYDLKWNCHIDSINKNAKKHLYSLSQLIRFGLPLLVRSRSIHVLSSLTVSPCTLVKTCHVISRHVGRFWLTSTQPYRLLHLKEESIIEVTFSHRFV